MYFVRNISTALGILWIYKKNIIGKYSTIFCENLVKIPLKRGERRFFVES